MKYKILRGYIRSKNIERPYHLSNCRVVIEARSYFKGVSKNYEKSGCQYILGAECDRYANHLKKKLNCLIKSGVTCYVVFTGGMKADLEKRKEIHERLIQRRLLITAENFKDNFYDPILAKDVHLEVLDELKVEYSFCEYDCRETVVCLANKWRCPVVTDNIEYCFFGVSCVLTDSIMYEEEHQRAMCSIYQYDVFQKSIRVNTNNYVMLLTLFDEDSKYFYYLPGAIVGTRGNVIKSITYWFLRKSKDELKKNVSNYLRSETDRQMFLELYDENENILQAARKAAMNYCGGKKPTIKLNTDNRFLQAVSNGEIAIPYINLTKIGIFSGCWIMPDERKKDAMLAAIDIIGYTHCLLTSSQHSKLKFIGREKNECYIREIEQQWDTPIKFKLRRPSHKMCNPFYLFLHERLHGFDYNTLKRLRLDCWVLFITLVYYIKKHNKDFVRAAYSVILSHVMLGYVSELVGLIKRTNIFIHHNDRHKENVYNGLLYKDCVAAAVALMDSFYINDLKNKYDPSVLHDFIEFQHCLQHMNYLNKMCGETVPRTIYSKSFNGTFVYNVHYLIKDKENPVGVIETILGKSSVTSLFKNMIDVFEKCLESVEDLMI